MTYFEAILSFLGFFVSPVMVAVYWFVLAWVAGSARVALFVEYNKSEYRGLKRVLSTFLVLSFFLLPPFFIYITSNGLGNNWT